MTFFGVVYNAFSLFGSTFFMLVLLIEWVILDFLNGYVFFQYSGDEDPNQRREALNVKCNFCDIFCWFIVCIDVIRYLNTSNFWQS